MRKEIKAILKKRFSDIAPEVKQLDVIKKSRKAEPKSARSQLAIGELKEIFLEHKEKQQENSKLYPNGNYGRVKIGFADDNDDKPQWAVKILKDKSSKSGGIMAHEARMHRLLGREAYAGVRKKSEDQFKYYLIMPYLGEDLTKYLKRYGTLPARECIAAFLPTILELAIIHSVGLRVGDIKLKNTLIARDTNKVFHLIDFGGACFEDEMKLVLTDIPPDLFNLAKSHLEDGKNFFDTVQQNYTQSADVYLMDAMLAELLPYYFTIKRESAPGIEHHSITVKNKGCFGSDSFWWLVDLVTEMTNFHSWKRPTITQVLQALSTERIPSTEDPNLSQNPKINPNSRLLFKQYQKINNQIKGMMAEELIRATQNGDEATQNAIRSQYSEFATVKVACEEKVKIDEHIPLLKTLEISPSEVRSSIIEPWLDAGHNILEIDQSGKFAFSYIAHFIQNKQWKNLDTLLTRKPQLLNAAISLSESKKQTLFDYAVENKQEEMRTILYKHLPSYFHQNSQLDLCTLKTALQAADKDQLPLFNKKFCDHLDKVPSRSKTKFWHSSARHYQRIQSDIKDLRDCIGPDSPNQSVIQIIENLFTYLKREKSDRTMTILIEAINISIPALCPETEKTDSTKTKSIMHQLEAELKSASQPDIQVFLDSVCDELPKCARQAREQAQAESWFSGRGHEAKLTEVVTELKAMKASLSSPTDYKQVSQALTNLNTYLARQNSKTTKDAFDQTLLSSLPTLFGSKKIQSQDAKQAVMVFPKVKVWNE